jgi:hypothetical protein
VEAACVKIVVDPQTVGADGVITDPRVREQLVGVLATLAGVQARNPELDHV